MSKKKCTATAVVTLKLKVNPTDVWGGDCSVEQVREQAAEQAIGMVGRLLAETGGRVRSVGTPTVQVVVVEDA